MNIEEFYDADERRRESPELELGNEWRDADGYRYDLSYVVDTGELYSMAAPEGDSPGQIAIREGERLWRVLLNCAIKAGIIVFA